MKHVAPHRWADRTLSAEQRARMNEHAAGCAQCARGRERVLGAREAFASIAEAQPPELRWEHVGARIYWSTSQERRATASNAAIRATRPRWWLAPAIAVGVGAAGLTAWLALASRGEAPIANAQLDVPAPAPSHLEITPVQLVEMPSTAPVPMIGLVTLARGDVDVAGARDATAVFAQPVVAGLPIATGDGQLAVQLEAGTGFAIGPHSSLSIARLDRGAIELHVDGTISVEVSHRAPDQRFVVVAGDRTVEVRGTQFEVSHQGGVVSVSCRRGLVAVRDAGAQSGDTVEVAAGTRWGAGDDEPLTLHAPAPIDDAQIAALAARGPVMLPAWSDAPSILRTTGPLAIGAPVGRAIRLDGVVLGRGDLAVRVMSGRHLVETERSAGHWAPGQWVATRDDGAPVKVSSAAEPQRGGVSARRAELEHNLASGRMQSCLRTLAKQGLSAGTHVDVEIGVDATGAIGYLNVVDTDLPASVASCVRDAVADVHFGAGAAAQWRHRFTF